jgi:3-deoxy-manno-octulosonate cytidylyltransferase (CMP-KDO synthetase)
LHPIAGKPLLKHVWERCLRARNLDSVVIATDDMRIASAAFDWGAEVALTSPKHGSGTNRVAEVARKTNKLIDKLVEQLRSDRKVGIVTAAHPFENPADASSRHQVKVVVDLHGNALYFSRAPIPAQGNDGFSGVVPARQLPNRRPLFLRHQGIYGFRRETLLQFVRWKPSPLECTESLEQLRALENGVKVHVLITAAGSPGIDTPEDAIALEQKLASAKGRMPS